MEAEELDVVVNQKEETKESVSQSVTPFKSPQDRRGENDKAQFELSPPSADTASCLCLRNVCERDGRDIIAKHFLLNAVCNPKTSESHPQQAKQGVQSCSKEFCQTKIVCAEVNFHWCL